MQNQLGENIAIFRKEKGYTDIEKGNVEDAASAFAAFRERH